MASMVTVAIVGYLLNAAFKGAVNTKVVSKYLR
jgi:hypothetical protein